jgi:hypothetical protein
MRQLREIMEKEFEVLKSRRIGAILAHIGTAKSQIDALLPRIEDILEKRHIASLTDDYYGRIAADAEVAPFQDRLACHAVHLRALKDALAYDQSRRCYRESIRDFLGFLKYRGSKDTDRESFFGFAPIPILPSERPTGSEVNELVGSYIKSFRELRKRQREQGG